MLKTTIRARLTAASLSLLAPAAAIMAGPALSPLGLSPIAVAHAQSATSDTAFVQSLSDKLVGVVNGPGSAAEKRSAVVPLLSQDVDVDSIGRFCLGRFWRAATPAQQQRYLALFHQVLVNTITGKLGDYKGVSIAVSPGTVQDGASLVPTVINRPGQPSASVQWKISDESGSPKVVDVVAEGVSLRLTQRSDYASYLAHNGNNLDALLNALTRQVSRTS